MPDTASDHRSSSLPAGKFRDPLRTASGEARAHVHLTALRTLWFNTGSLCNIACDNCYIESSPKNDRLSYLPLDDVLGYLDEIAVDRLPVEEIGFTGGEPFLNPQFLPMLAAALARGFRVLVLTNAMKPMQRHEAALLALRAAHGDALTLRVSIDHYQPAQHEAVRGPRTWAPMRTGLRWLAAQGFRLTVAGRTLWGESEAEMRAGFARLFAAEGIPVDAFDPEALILFPEMRADREVPEITTRCWGLLGVDPGTMMCATSRMVIRRKGDAAPAVVSCTLLPYDHRFELGRSLREASGPVALNHPFCAQFCVLGGASCSARR